MNGNQFWCLSFNVMTTSFMKGQKPCVNGLGLLPSKACNFISKGTSEGHRGQSSCSLNQVSYNCFSKSCMLPAQSAERKDSFLRVRNFLQNCHFFWSKGLSCEEIHFSPDCRNNLYCLAQISTIHLSATPGRILLLRKTLRVP